MLDSTFTPAVAVSAPRPPGAHTPTSAPAPPRYSTIQVGRCTGGLLMAIKVYDQPTPARHRMASREARVLKYLNSVGCAHRLAAAPRAPALRSACVAFMRPLHCGRFGPGCRPVTAAAPSQAAANGLAPLPNPQPPPTPTAALPPSDPKPRVPNVPRLYSAYATASQVHLLQEWCAGGDLRAALAQRGCGFPEQLVAARVRRRDSHHCSLARVFKAFARALRGVCAEESVPSLPELSSLQRPVRPPLPTLLLGPPALPSSPPNARSANARAPMAPRSRRRCCARWTPCTPRAWCTATSSWRTCLWTRPAARASAVSVHRSGATSCDRCAPRREWPGVGARGQDLPRGCFAPVGEQPPGPVQPPSRALVQFEA